jgi:hypothetical protein
MGQIFENQDSSIRVGPEGRPGIAGSSILHIGETDQLLGWEYGELELDDGQVLASGGLGDHARLPDSGSSPEHQRGCVGIGEESIQPGLGFGGSRVDHGGVPGAWR